MARAGLPPLLAQITGGTVTWQRLEGLKYDVLGYFLCCHLVIEHYLDEYLRIRYSTLDWDAARFTFGQKIALLSNFKVSEKYDCIPAIKHMNSLRNKLSHNIEFKIDADSLLPLRQYLTKTYDRKRSPPNNPKKLLEEFTTMVCVLFAGYISAHAATHSKHTRK